MKKRLQVLLMLALMVLLGSVAEAVLTGCGEGTAHAQGFSFQGGRGPAGPQGPAGPSGPPGADLTASRWNYGTTVDAPAQDGTHITPLFRWGVLAPNELRIGEGTLGVTRGIADQVSLSAATRCNFYVGNVSFGGFDQHGTLPGLLLNKPRIWITNLNTTNTLLAYEAAVQATSVTGKALIVLAQTANSTTGAAVGGPLWLMGGAAGTTTGTALAGDVQICGGKHLSACEGNVGMGFAPTVDTFEVGTYQGITANGMKRGAMFACATPPSAAPTGGAYFYADETDSCKLKVWNPGDPSPHAL